MCFASVISRARIKIFMKRFKKVVEDGEQRDSITSSSRVGEKIQFIPCTFCPLTPFAFVELSIYIKIINCLSMRFDQLRGSAARFN